MHADWPPLPYADWTSTREALHLWTQIVGKVRLARTPWLNHSWHVTLYVTPRGLATGPIPHGDRIFDMEFDFVRQLLVIRASPDGERTIPLARGSVADFYAQVMRALAELGVPVAINIRPNEIADAIPFTDDHAVRDYDPDAANRFWRALVQIDRVFKHFRTAFLGKASPVHFFWGSFDMAVTRFSGRTAPPHPGGIPALPDAVAREAYSHEVSSAGFWPGGGGGIDYPAFYSYAYPTPPGFADGAAPGAGFFSETLGEYVLPYDAVRDAADPGAALTDFLQWTYARAADCAGWDRAALECAPGAPRVCRPTPGA